MAKKVSSSCFFTILTLACLSFQHNFAFQKLRRVDIYVVDKQIKFAAPLREKKLKQPAYYVKYSIVNQSRIADFEFFLRSVPEELKKQKRREHIAVYILAELYFDDGSSVSFGVNSNKKLSFNGRSTSLSGEAFITQCIKPYISPTFHWYLPMVKTPEKVPVTNTDFHLPFDGFRVYFSQKLPSLDYIEQTQYFTQDEFDQIFIPENGDLWVGIDVNTKKIVSIQFPSNLKRLDNGGMNIQLLKKYKAFVFRRINVKQIENPYQLKADIIYRALEFSN
ncbi:hypothetical protein BKI52_36910 [marine bacterium AO1-C]|nr:hypothetical protein BKI52_36910 [marine bacterium AO1-C]